MPVYTVVPLRGQFAISQFSESSKGPVLNGCSYVKDKHGRIRMFPTMQAAGAAIDQLKATKE